MSQIPNVQIIESSEIYRNKGTNNYFRKYYVYGDDMIVPFMEQIGEEAVPSEVYTKWMEVAKEILSKNRE